VVEEARSPTGFASRLGAYRVGNGGDRRGPRGLWGYEVLEEAELETDFLDIGAVWWGPIPGTEFGLDLVKTFLYVFVLHV